MSDGWIWLSYYAVGYWPAWFAAIEQVHEHAEESARQVLSSAIRQIPVAVSPAVDDARAQLSRWN
ncbi:hypothetical protein GCM10010168_15220 [Actinoplanes ianthinogenes]|uniref:Uncharacterized protein n=1 Tax=Actinoplanes ianthinogenes TaxID=122358 RepID=A0ABM7LZI1_9ACTN|nr:hypothetical protein [Actinoplanes ianthinogenes]BCJ44709.1 hypothetical protein Aiant_53660 [Actinoplanes ianthinogenes]GGQ99523.1 hypothetical protein GCM10010168_15220 [Actinoplanes ianthinogenes]